MQSGSSDVRGEIVESGPTEAILRQPLHPYTQALLTAIPDFSTPANSLTAIPGVVPDLRKPLPGCRFQPRCPGCRELCEQQRPDYYLAVTGHFVRCWNLAGGGTAHAAFTETRSC